MPPPAKVEVLEPEEIIRGQTSYVRRRNSDRTWVTIYRPEQIIYCKKPILLPSK